jgi:hypothetical protein
MDLWQTNVSGNYDTKIETFFNFFFLDEKETKSQESSDGKSHKPLGAADFRACALFQLNIFLNLKFFVKTLIPIAS